jgi:2-dehydropantoate 2-reductase
MKICLVGAGAIGGYLAVKLGAAGADVTIIARGANLTAIQSNGLRLISATGETTYKPVLATADTREAGPQDAVIVAVKSHQLADLAPTLPALYGPETVVMPAQNGVPWWYFYQHGGPLDGRPVTAVDPQGILAHNIPNERVLGCVVYPAAELVSPGVIRHIENNRFSLGEPDGSRSGRVEALSKLFSAAGLKAPVRPDIRTEIWIKLLGNLSFNPISALTGATLAGICRDSHGYALAYASMQEAQNVAAALGIRFPMSIETRISWALAVGEHKTSTLQDIEAGRKTEIDALVGAVVELGQLTNIPTPLLAGFFHLVKLREIGGG